MGQEGNGGRRTWRRDAFATSETTALPSLCILWGHSIEGSCSGRASALPSGAVAVANALSPSPEPRTGKGSARRVLPALPPRAAAACCEPSNGSAGLGCSVRTPHPPQARENAAAVGEAVRHQFPSGGVCPLSTQTDIQPESSDRAGETFRNRIADGTTVPVLRVPCGHHSSFFSEKKLLLSVSGFSYRSHRVPVCLGSACASLGLAIAATKVLATHCLRGSTPETLTDSSSPPGMEKTHAESKHRDNSSLSRCSH